MDQSVLSLLAQGLASSRFATYRSGIRQYTAFCWQFGLTPLPLSDLNLCCFVLYLHQQHLSPASVCLYLATLHDFQTVAGGHDPQPGEFPRLQYAVWAVRQLTPSQSWPLRLPITPSLLQSLHRRWSPPPVFVCCGLPAVLVFMPFSSVESSPAHCQLPTTPHCCRGATSRLTAILPEDRPLGKIRQIFLGLGCLCSWVTQATPSAQLQQCCLTSWFGLTGQVPCSCIRIVAHCHGLIWWQQIIKPWLQKALMCHVSTAIVFELELLPPRSRLASQTPSFSLWVTGNCPHS